ncbi:MAG: uncharacterized protein QOD44_2782 [Solirubrobacteraceae bacterium]|nr:uncharacterized protein [Solirubrobacteraceae bacterium]
MDDLRGELLAFVAALRDDGVTITTGQALLLLEAVAATGPADIYWAGRATLLTRHGDIAAYDRAFRRFWGGGAAARTQRIVPAERIRAAAHGAGDEPSGRQGAPATLAHRGLASDIEVLREKSFAAMSEAELRALAQAMASLEVAVAMRRSRRRRPARRGEIDLRRTMRASLRAGGRPAAPARRRRREAPRRIVLLLDVSASMMAFSRALMLYAHATLRTHPRCEAFCFSTRLTRVSRALSRADPDAALAAAAAEVDDWDGGTRIGESVKAFLDRHGHRGVARGAVVVICSDGLDVGDAVMLGEQMERLARLAHRVVWINPLQAEDGYEPLAKGMRAALAHVDTFASGHSLAALESLELR